MLYRSDKHARMVNAHAEASAAASPKLSSVAAMEPMSMENSSQERKVRSAAKKTFGSTRIGTWMPVVRINQKVSASTWQTEEIRIPTDNTKD